MAPRVTKPKKVAAPIANGDNPTNDPPVAVKRSARGRKAVAEENNAELATANGNVKPAPKRVAAVKKTKNAANAIDVVGTAPTGGIKEDAASPKQAASESKTAERAAKAPPKLKAVSKPNGKTASKDNGVVEPVPEPEIEESVAPAAGKVKSKAKTKIAEPKKVVKPASKIEKKTKASAKSATATQSVEATDVASPQPSTSARIVPAVAARGRQKRENVKAIDAIIESPKPKRGKKQTAAAIGNDEATGGKTDAPMRTAFTKKSKNVAEENGNAVDEVVPVESAGAKRKKLQAKSKVVAEKPVPIAEKKVVNKRKAAEKAPVKETSDTEEDEQEVVPKKSRKKAAAADAKTKTKKAADGVKPKMNATETDFAKINFTSDKTFNMKICSFNVAGLRAFVAKGGHKYFEHEQPNIICLQEIKCTPDEVPEEAILKNYHPYWFAKPGGRGGVAILSKNLAHNVQEGLNDAEMDEEGRIITAEYEKFYLICVYVPNAGNKLVTMPRRLRWNKLFEEHVSKLNEKKPVIICGDMNVAHTEIDLTNPKTNKNNAGFTQQERDGMTDLLALGFTDTFRYLHPSVQKAYTFWSYRNNNRSKNIGWRLDYFITSDRLNPSIVDCFMRPEVLGSDHCPINLLLNI